MSTQGQQENLEWRRAHYSITYYDPLTRLTFIALVFIKTQLCKRRRAPFDNNEIYNIVSHVPKKTPTGTLTEKN